VPPPTPLQLVPKDAQIQAEIDEYGELQREIDLMAPKLQRHKILKEKLQKRMNDAGAEAERPTWLDGLCYQVQMTARRRERTLTNKKKAFQLLKKRLGQDGLLAVIEIPFGSAIDPHTTATEQKLFVTEELSGYRTLSVVALQPPQVAA
jgi:predicted RNase H-like nuclease (RuvC/YqgF family)